MRKEIFVRGSMVFIIGTILVAIGILTRRCETTLTRDNAFDGLHLYDSIDNHEYKPMVDLLPGTYELCYNFSSIETIREFYVNVLDPDGYEIKSIYGPPAMYVYQGANLTFETQKTGQHTFLLGGRWISVQVDLDKLTQSTEIMYPFIIAFYSGLPLFAGGIVVSISGALMKEKPTHWFDKIQCMYKNGTFKPRKLNQGTLVSRLFF